MKIKRIIPLIILFVLISTVVLAGTPVASGDTTMKLIKNEICEIKFGKYGKFTKEKVDIDLKNKTIDIKLTVSNDKESDPNETIEEEVIETKAGKIVFLVDISKSMSDNVTNINGQNITRKASVLKAAKELNKKLFEINKDIEVGVVGFATSIDPNKRGGIDDAVSITETLKKDENIINNALTKLETKELGPTTNIEVGLEEAEKLLNSTETDKPKYIIVLTDAIPNYAKNIQPLVYGENESQQGWKSVYDERVFAPTRKKLVELKNKGITPVSLLINMSDNQIAISTEDPKPTYKEAAVRIFGTELQPTAGPLYFVSDKDVTNTITRNIFNELTTKKKIKKQKNTNNEVYELTDIIIKDYFPKNIVENFDFSYIVKPNIGTISKNIDKTDNSITWKIDKLKQNERASCTYRLKLKSKIDSSIIGINLPTNKNVTVDYKENGTQGERKQNNKCPVVALDLPALKKIPQTGEINAITVLGIMSVASIVIFICYKKIK